MPIRNATGNKYKFKETFYDNGSINMADIPELYKCNSIDVPIRVVYIPTMAGKNLNVPGYDNLGRLSAIGYLKGLMEGEKTKYV